LSNFIINPYVFQEAEPELLFNENYESTSDWTFVRSEFSIDSGGNGLLLASSVPDNALAQAYRTMPDALPSEFTLKIEYKPTSTTNNIFPFCVSYNSTQVLSQLRGIGVRCSGATKMILFSVSSGSVTNSSVNSSLVKDTQYYIKIVNDDSNVTMDIFTGSDYETGQVGSTVSITDPGFTDLTILQHCGRSDGGGGGTSFAINNFSSFEP